MGQLGAHDGGVTAMSYDPAGKFLLTAGADGLASRHITNPRIQKPGLALAGYLPYVKPGRLQILGESEYAYLDTLGAAGYYQSGPEMGIKVCLEGASAESDRMLDRLPG